MKYGFLVAVAAAFLTACGGGSSGVTPQPVRTNPPVTYTSYLRFTGALAGHTIQSDLRRAQSVALDAGTPIPIMVIAPIASSGDIGSGSYQIFGGTVEAVVSPEPSATPSATFTNTNPDAQLSPPQMSLPSGVIAAQVATSNGTPNVQASGVVTANIGAPVNQAPTTAVYTYAAISLECVSSAMAPGSAAAWKWTGSAWATATDPAQADVYLSGPRCNTPGSTTTDPDPTVHFPAGGVVLSTDTPFSSITASQWANTVTSLDLLQAITQNPDGSDNAIVVAKTASGAIFKMFPNGLGSYNYEYSGAIEVSGSSVDGF